MKISEVVEELLKIKEQYGDLDVMCPPVAGDDFRSVERVGPGQYDDGTIKADIMDATDEEDD